MAEARKSNISPPSGTGPIGDGGGPGFHPQQMHQPYSYRPNIKYQLPTGVPQQRPVMVPYEQHSISQQPGPYAHHAPYQQFPHQQHLQQQQQQLHQQQQQQQQLHHQLQQLHQQPQMQFTQQPDNLQHSMEYSKDTQKSSQIESQTMNLTDEEASNEEIQERESSIQPTTAAVKADDCTSGGSAKEASQTPAEVERLAKELEAVRAAHVKQVKELEAQIKALHEQKSEKEVKYLRVPSSVQKKKEQETIKNTRRRSTLNVSEEEGRDTCGDLEQDYGFDSCPSPALSVQSNVSIKEEPEDNLTFNIQGVFPQGLEDKDNKGSTDKETAKIAPDKKPTITYVTDFDFCIFCQTKSEKKGVQVTEDNLATIQSIVLNVDCEASMRLKDYIMDIDMFLNNLPQYHSPCQKKLKNKLENIRNERRKLDETNFLLCIFCQEHKSESLSKFTSKGLATFQRELDQLDDEIIEKLNNFFNFDRVKNIMNLELTKEDFSPDKLKMHKYCRLKFKKKYRVTNSLKISNLKPANKDENAEISSDKVPENQEENVEITPDEEVFELLVEREKKIEEEKQRKKRKELPEPDEFNYKVRCALCGYAGTGTRGKFRTIKNINIQKTKDKANENHHFDIVKIVDHAVEFHQDLFCHNNCFTNYHYNDRRVKKGTYDCYEMAFRAIIPDMEDPLFRNCKVLPLVELRENFLKKLLEFDIKGHQKMRTFIERIKKYYTFDNKCRVNATPYPDYFIYSNHLSESQVNSQINLLKKGQVLENLADSNKDSTDSEVKKKWRFSCTECDYKCCKKSSLKNHIKKHELKSIKAIMSKQIMCELCGKMSKNKDCLKIHMRIHSGVKYPCSFCARNYYSQNSLNNHLLVHTGEKNIECPDCGKKFFGQSFLNNHIKKVHKTIGNEFLCFECGKGFRTKQNLKDHSRRHSDDRPFICKECGKTFKHRSVLRTHLLAHQGKKPQMCSICSYGCYTKANLSLHMAKHAISNEQTIFSSTEQANEKNLSENYIHLDDIKAQIYFPL